MNLDTTDCRNCGTRVSVAARASYLFCPHCAAVLAVKRTKFSIKTETNCLNESDQCDGEPASLGELERIDRQWAKEREKYLIYRESCFWKGLLVPTHFGSIVRGASGVILGTLATVIALSLDDFGFWAGGPFTVLPLIAMGTLVAGVVREAVAYRKATQYQSAYRAYFQRWTAAFRSVRGSAGKARSQFGQRRGDY